MELKEKVFCVNKPLGWTSADVVGYIKKIYKFKKVGHAGTLDPNATGVLVIGVNEGTKQLSQLILNDKTYLAQIQFGIETDSYDITGKVVKTNNKTFNQQMCDEAINEFVKKDYYQYPPIYSAIKVNGKKLYEYARKNEQVKIEPRLVKINSIIESKYDVKTNTLTIQMNVSKGFYIRSFAHDLGKQLNSCACLKSLCRTSSGEFNLSKCIPIDFPKN